MNTQTSIPISSTNSLFGNTTPTPSTSSLFGNTTTTTTTPSTSLFGNTATPSTSSLFGNTTTPSTSLFGNTTTTPSTSLFGNTTTTTAATTTTLPTTPSTSLFGNTTTINPSTSLFGTTTTTTPSTSLFGNTTTTSNSLFGTSNNLFNTTTTTTSNINISSNIPFSESHESIKQEMNKIQTLINQQKKKLEEVQQRNPEEILKTKELISSLNQSISLLFHTLENNMQFLQNFKKEVYNELKNAEFAVRIMEKIKFPNNNYQKTFSSPSEYFLKLVNSFEKRMQQYNQYIEEIEKYLTLHQNGKPLTPLTLQEIIKNQYDFFLVTAGQIANLHESVEDLKEKFINYRKKYFNINPKETELLFEIKQPKKLYTFQFPSFMQTVTTTNPTTTPSLLNTSTTNPTTTSSLFNTSTANPTTSSLFNTSTTNPTTTSSLFNTSTTNPTTTSSLFNTSTTNPTTSSLFNTSTTNPTASLFNTPTTNPTTTSLFNTPTTNIFGVSSTNINNPITTPTDSKNRKSRGKKK